MHFIDEKEKKHTTINMITMLEEYRHEYTLF
jgi:hypothetical protein